ncbi:2-Methylisocitrate lyase, PEP mutase family [Roseovarius pacificus]|uniref:2-Methylisocitrate lyase, PEP mutase family n=1 Tax=Roseovarius pacificus TaxID=337701 RepID=A0A1M7H0P2_9RHOB|nr:isocitrate lyase/phosphoenolpyruvate mutase family protein [Roseovarius pacificus]GGO60043.1 carboxyvinyl-carboxyphosphonate phosphorylmutase [Roseovarius pacificus]SHM21933.1 2-Methylisocitrate lyase, PEP mutase family [Roseovarius pacificus]
MTDKLGALDGGRSLNDLPGRRKALKALVAEESAALLPGAANALTARIIEDLGFHAAYLTGAGLTNTHLGMPDLGLVTASDLVETTARISDVCQLPLVVDMDTGFGNALNAYTTFQRLERAGASAVQLEDQVFPKKCGHFSGKDVVPLGEMLGKLRACLDARQDDNLQIIARTDARAVLGFEAAMERAHAMIEEGADIIFVEAPETLEEIKAISQLPAPQLINFVVGGRTPMVELDYLKESGFAFVLYANAALQASVKAVQEVLGSLKEHGSLYEVSDRLADFDERQRIVGKPIFDALSQRYEGA